jgi:hypothetical protein
MINDEDYSDCVATLPDAKRAHASDDGQGFEIESLRRLTREHLHGASTEHNYSSGSPDHTLVYNAVYPSYRDLTACGSWDEIRSSTPNRKSKPTMRDMHLNNLSTISVNQSVTEYASSFLSHKAVDQVSDLCVSPAETNFTDIPILFPTVENSSELVYPPDALSKTPDQHLLTRSPSAYILLATLGRGVYGKVSTARLKENPDGKIYMLKTIPKASLVQRGVAELTKELWILRFITDASLSNKPFPFVQKLKENFQDEKNLFIVLVNHPYFFCL